LPIELKCGPVHVALRFVSKYMRKRGRLQTETHPGIKGSAGSEGSRDLTWPFVIRF
jgi:hypothetical protein